MTRSVCLFLLLVVACASPESENGALLGTWSIEKIRWISSDTTITIHPSQKGLLLVNEGTYSISWSPLENKRKPFVDLANPTEEEKQIGFQSIVFNAGNCTIGDSKFITTARIAKVPGFEGGKQYYYYDLKEDTLTLTLYDETYPNGKKPTWYGTWRTEFTLVKVQANSDNAMLNL